MSQDIEGYRYDRYDDGWHSLVAEFCTALLTRLFLNIIPTRFLLQEEEEEEELEARLITVR